MRDRFYDPELIGKPNVARHCAPCPFTREMGKIASMLHVVGQPEWAAVSHSLVKAFVAQNRLGTPLGESLVDTLYESTASQKAAMGLPEDTGPAQEVVTDARACAQKILAGQCSEYFVADKSDGGFAIEVRPEFAVPPAETAVQFPSPSVQD